MPKLLLMVTQTLFGAPIMLQAGHYLSLSMDGTVMGIQR